MAKHGTHIRPEWKIIECPNVFGGRRPRLLGLQGAEHVLARHRFDAAEQVGGIFGIRIHRRQRAVAKQNGGHAVAHRLAKPGIEQHLGVVVRVDVDEARDDPLALGVDDVGAPRFVERLCGHRGHDAVANAQRTGLRGCAGSVEPEPVANDHVVSHQETVLKIVSTYNLFCTLLRIGSSA